MPNITELVLIAMIVMLTFGVGKLPNIATALGRARADFKKGLAEAEPVDITPEGGAKAEADGERKPGRFDQKVDDAELDEPA